MNHRINSKYQLTRVFSIVAVHGLNGHGYGTWTSFTDEKAAQEMMWLRDILPSQATDARIIAYGYNSALLGSDTSVSSIHDFGLDLLQRISSYKDLDKPSVLDHQDLTRIYLLIFLRTARGR